MMKVTLVKPPEQSVLDFGTFSLAVLAAAVRDLADIVIVDATFCELGDAVTRTLETDPEIIGVTTMGLTSVEPTTHFLKALRNAGFTNLLIIGGHGATMTPLPLLEAGADAVVYGEGEETFREVLQKGISESVRRLILFRDSIMVKTPPRTTNFDPVPECRPTISPRVVITADVSPKEMPVRNESFIYISSIKHPTSYSVEPRILYFCMIRIMNVFIKIEYQSYYCLPFEGTIIAK